MAPHGVRDALVHPRHHLVPVVVEGNVHFSFFKGFQIVDRAKQKMMYVISNSFPVLGSVAEVLLGGFHHFRPFQTPLVFLLDLPPMLLLPLRVLPFWVRKAFVAEVKKERKCKVYKISHLLEI